MLTGLSNPTSLQAWTPRWLTATDDGPLLVLLGLVLLCSGLGLWSRRRPP